MTPSKRVIDMHYELREPFDFDGRTYRFARVVRVPKVRDRIHASAFVQDNFPNDTGDAILAATLSAVSEYGCHGGDNAEWRRLPADALIDGLSYPDFIALVGHMGHRARDFSDSPNETSGPPSAPSVEPGMDPEQHF